MRVLTLRLDEDTHQRLKDAAQEDTRSIQGELEWMILSMLAMRDAGKLGPTGLQH